MVTRPHTALITLITLITLLSGCAWDDFFDDTEYQSASRQKPREPTEFYTQRLNALTVAEPYMRVVDLPEFVGIELDHHGLRQTDLSASDINFVERVVLITNQAAQSHNEQIYDEDIHRFFLEHTLLNQGPFQVNVKENDGLKTTESALCGGNFSLPAACEPFSPQTLTWSTEQEVINFLKGLGFHQTMWYASGSKYDYTKPVAWPCGRVYRLQAIIEHRAEHVWSYRDQHDLNPEIFNWPTFPWVVPWWGGYVRWWHRSYC